MQFLVAPTRPLSRSRPAYSLVEAVIGVTLFALLAGGVIGMTLFVRRTAEETVYHNTALTIAQAYVEQIRSIDYPTLAAAARDATGTVPLSLMGADGDIIRAEGNTILGNGRWATETIMLDENSAGEPTQPMTFRFRPVLVELDTATGGAASGVEITLFYETTHHFGSVRTHQGQLRTVRSNVPTY